MRSKISLLFLLIISFFSYAQQDIKVISSDFNSILVEYTPFYTDTSLIKTDNGNFRNIEIFEGELINSDSWGEPAIQKRKVMLGVPSEFGNTIEILSSSYKIITGEIVPIPTPIPDSQLTSFDIKKAPDYSSTKNKLELVSFGEYGLLRGLGTQVVVISPIDFDAGSNQIKLFTKIIFKVNFGNQKSLSSKTITDDLIKSSIINYDVARNWIQNRSGLKKTQVINSVLASGKWIRFEAPEEGIYKITKSTLTAFGMNPENIDPRTIKIYNNGGKVVPENLGQSRPNDLVENAITVVGEEDGKFDDNDYIIFYGRGNNFWDIDSDGKTISRFFNPYSKQNYYWITYGGANGKRMANKLSLADQADYIQNSTDAFADWEVDKINLGKTGRQFAGDDFTQTVSSRTYMNKLDGRISTYPINYNFRFIIGSSTGVTLNVTENGTQVFSQFLPGYGAALYTAGFGSIKSFSFSDALPDNRSVLNFKVTPSSVTSVGYLDYFTLSYKKELKAFNDYLLFYSDPVNNLIEYDLNGFSSSNINVYDVTDYSNVKIVTNSQISAGECKFKFNESATARSKYIAVGKDVFKTPINPVEIQNQNLHAEQTGAKFIIITHKNFIDAAKNLKNYKENQAPIHISTYIADVDEIYNEFSGGQLDPTAVRDFIKYAYDNWQITPEYVLLFGKGTYDYKNIEGYGDNFVPTWQSIESLSLVNSYSTDDYFVRVSGDDPVVDLALGRITCRNVEEANNIVNKIKDYELNQEKGNWRNLITLVADDGRTSTTYEGSEHTAPSENLANIYFPKSFDINKIYSAAYPDVLTGQGRRKPLVNQAIINAINDGTLFLNYIGHGSPDLWAHEVIFEKSVSIPQLKNDKYFFLCAATCDFGYFDIPNFQSAAEALIMLPNTGAIASFTADRLVYSQINHALNYAFVQTLFGSPRDTLNLSIPIGKASFLTKRTRVDINDQKYNIFGDPTLRLLIPQYSANIDSVNGQSLSVDVQIKALSKTKIEGRILKPDNTTWDDFNGEGLLTFFDSERTVLLDQIGNYPVTVQGGIIFNGRVSVNNGKFSADFVVPKDISYENKKGKVIFYFLNNSVDGIGYSDNVIVGGTDSSVVNDGKGPTIEIYFDDVAYNNSYLVNPNPKLLVKLYDETGLNTTGTGVGHKLEGVLNDQITAPIDFTNHFKGDLDAGGKSGTIDYQFNNLQAGDYHILVKAWDVFNNLSEENSYFSVVEGNDLAIRNVYNYPNPFKGSTQFTFQQNLTKPIDVKIKIYTIAGRLIKEIEKYNLNEKFVVIDWDGRDEDGDNLASGTYLYKLIVKSSDGEFQKSVLGKLAVIN